ncbi:hypothetical protein EA462_06035 [Natrarchaeobius halalkaliphilus]|uniref:Uncharacterized protein n=1 Tax=Natrarchaeobius halalkaliphilus TaxID=1679091 RepID=A0A3N6P1U8_9EURY|nr:alginate lyase family protein [Natrarchaeobius halalkaliphilus]RQG91519.1 hypothetical protein EA462_06035 [Natrarchaeobius halalkaliphilus]
MTDHLTLLGTAMNKRPEQLLGVCKRSLKGKLLPRLPVNVDRRYERRTPENPTAVVEPIRENTAELQRSTASRRETFRERANDAADGTLTFLNESVEFPDGDRVSLSPERLEEQSLHWKLKCWGFEHLKPVWLGYTDPKALSGDQRRIHRRWLDEWINAHPIAAEPGYLRREWMPHAVCLRIWNWSRYDATFGEGLSPDFRRDIRRFVYKNAAFLSDNVEYGVGGNHLIENGAALVIAGVYLDEDRWRRQGRQILERAASNQFFDDGGHVERSPMYHAIVCQRYLSAHSLLSTVGEPSGEISRCALESARFLQRLRPPDDRIPLLNDSVFGEALALTECLAYARAVGVSDGSSGTEIGRMDGSGFYWLGGGDDRMLVAAHEITVPHLPAHAHAHPGHVCLWIDGQRVLTDTGVYEYAAGPRRQHARSARSHNTVQVGRTEPARMASSFWLWGRLGPTVSFAETDGTLEFSYSVDGIGRPTYRHDRKITHESRVWTVGDRVDSNGKPVTSRLHVHPAFDARMANDRVRIEDTQAEPVLSVAPSGHERVSVETAPYYPEYGRERPRDVIVLRHSQSEPLWVQFESSTE